jgi:mannose-6-phosphate isomerase-like protein (cupin superfamily)
VNEVTLVGLTDVEPVVLGGGSWSRILIDRATAASTATTLGYSEFAPQTSTDHMSHDCDELAYIVSGTGLIRLDGEAVAVEPDSACHIPAGVWHTVVNPSSDTPLEMVFVFDSPSYPPTERRPSHSMEET